MDEDRRLELTGEFLRMWLDLLEHRASSEEVARRIDERPQVRFQTPQDTSAAERSKRTTEAVKKIRKDLKG